MTGWKTYPYSLFLDINIYIYEGSVPTNFFFLSVKESECVNRSVVSDSLQPHGL